MYYNCLFSLPLAFAAVWTDQERLDKVTHLLHMCIPTAALNMHMYLITCSLAETDAEL